MPHDEPLIRVAGGRHQPEAELVADLLLQEGIPSLVRRSAGFDVPDYMAGGPRDVLVRASSVEAARAVLATNGFTPSGSPAPIRAWPVLAGLVLGLAVILVAALLAAS